MKLFSALLVAILLTVSENYVPAPALKQDAVVNMQGRITNSDKLDEFIDNVQMKQECEIQVVYYTDEGAPIIRTLYYDGSTIKSIFDNTRDHYSNINDRIVKVHYFVDIKVVTENGQRCYYLIDKNGKEEWIFIAII